MGSDNTSAISPEERDLAIRTMIGEEGSPSGQAGVGSVMLNRLQSGRFGDSLAAVILAPNQFEPWTHRANELLSISPNDRRYQQAARIFDAVAGGDLPDMTGGATHFYAPKAQAALGRQPPSWAQGQGQNLGQSLFYAPEGVASYQPGLSQTAASKAAPVDPPLDAWGTYQRAHGQSGQSLPPAGGVSNVKSAPAKSASEDDLMGMYFGTGQKAAPPAPKSIAPADAAPVDDALMRTYFGAAAAPSSAPKAEPVMRAIPADAKPGPNGLLWNDQGGFDPQSGELIVAGKPMGSAPSQALSAAAGVVEGVPVAGPSLLSGAQKVAAASSALQEGAPSNALEQAKAQNQNLLQSSEEAFPNTNAAGQVAGGIVGTAPLMAAAPAAFGLGEGGLAVNALRSTGGGAVLGGADGGARNGWDRNAMQEGAERGGVLGMLGPAAGRLVGAGVNAAGMGGSLVGNALAGGVGGAAIGGAGAGMQSGGFNPLNWDISTVEKGALVGAGVGAGLPLAGAAVGKTVNALSRVTPAGQNVANVLSDIGMTPDEARAALDRIGPHATLADIDPSLTTEAGALAALGGKPTSILKGAMAQRAAGADDRMSQAVTETLGPKPDAEKILADIRAREGAMTTDKDAARAALDASMGAAKDPHAELQSMVATRSAAAQPLYEKAMQGGSMAPLEHQFQAAFSDAADASSKAAKDLAAAQQQQLLARAQVSRAGENVYANNSALEASRQADAAVAQAEKAAAAANANKEAIRARLQQAQADGSANAPGAVWNPRIQQFLDDPIMQAGLAKGARIQRLESLAEGKPFDPTEYAIVGQDEAGNPIVGSVPNMRTLNVAKKGLDSMVEAAKDSVTGRLSEEGRAIDQVRRSFLSELDKANPDYAAARASWAGPTQTHEAFNRGLSIFSNRSGPSGVNSTPGALESWLKGASEGEREAAKLGARSAFEQQMAAASSPEAKAAALSNKEVNQQKLAAILGKDEAGKLTERLNFKYEDPVGQAFSKGMDLFKAREGVAGVHDAPDAWRSWLSKASPAEQEAARQGARQAIEQAITSARQGDVSAARSLFAKSTANREKLEAMFPNAGKLFDALDNELRMRATEQRVAQNSATAERQAVQAKYRPGQAGGPLDVVPTLVGEAAAGGPGALAAALGSRAFHGMRNAMTDAALSRLTEGTARGLSATGALQDQFLREVGRAARARSALNALSNAGEAGTNLLVRQLGDRRNAMQAP
ncbi:hypothetical protein M2322_003185 [Rhodoblastus acidophilus]|uniref:cell wall hydrolase n=1 Tax=Rhodoblastus acidophilus TaxID=1074 RepID=UPI0022245CC3|nr:cell wall hydrolase [Rhodoblastus acidophilus]MCW2317621.1 hypothetical protein [Rhodoblastus acidophilus]